MKILHLLIHMVLLSQVAMSSKRDPAWKYGDAIEVGGKPGILCRICNKQFCGGVYRLKEHLGHVVGNIQACANVSSEIKLEMRNQLEGIEK